MGDGLPAPAFIFLGCVAGTLVGLIIFFLYLNKKLCFKECGGFPCIEKPAAKKDEANRLGSAYQYVDESSEDSEEEAERQYAMGVQRSASMRGIVRQADRLQPKFDPASIASMSSDEDTEGQTLDLTLGATAGDGDVTLVASDGGHDNEAYAVTPDKENLFDVSDLQQEEREIISRCGSLEVSLTYNAAKSQMTVTVIQAKEVPTRERGGAGHTQIHLILLPTKKQKYKTKVKPGNNPAYAEKFVFSRISPDEVNDMGVRFRLYGVERMRRERMIGEHIIGFAKINLDLDVVTQWLPLEPRSNLSGGDSNVDLSSLTHSDGASSTQSMQHGGMPELLVGLSYNGTTGRLAIEVIKGSNFRNLSMNRAPDSYVKLSLMSSSGQEIAHSKTSVRRGQPNPLFKETFMFQVALFQLPEVTLMVSVYNKRSMKRKEMIGWLSSGLNSSGEEELSHWADMRESKGEQVCRWHILLES